MERIPEPQLMADATQAAAYAAADFEAPHGRLVEVLGEMFPGVEIAGAILDLGCGPGDVTFRLARRFPRARITAVDGSAAMIALARRRRRREGMPASRVSFIVGRIPGARIPPRPYHAVVSTSLLHHFRDPAPHWAAVSAHARPGTLVFVWDLSRPAGREEAARMVERYSGDEPAVLRRDFHRSLLAAFTPREVRRQLAAAGLRGLSVRKVSDRHLIVFGRIA
ncbi:MAG: class I SAM-dependent methyltransferase [bacterium]|nr:class I SAM-dependent methyltransferase [bacterium]